MGDGSPSWCCCMSVRFSHSDVLTWDTVTRPRRGMGSLGRITDQLRLPVPAQRRLDAESHASVQRGNRLVEFREVDSESRSAMNATSRSTGRRDIDNAVIRVGVDPIEG